MAYAHWGLAWITPATMALVKSIMNQLVSDKGDIRPASEGTLINFASYLARSVRHSTKYKLKSLKYKVDGPMTAISHTYGHSNRPCCL